MNVVGPSLASANRRRRHHGLTWSATGGSLATASLPLRRRLHAGSGLEAAALGGTQRQAEAPTNVGSQLAGCPAITRTSDAAHVSLAKGVAGTAVTGPTPMRVAAAACRGGTGASCVDVTSFTPSMRQRYHYGYCHIDLTNHFKMLYGHTSLTAIRDDGWKEGRGRISVARSKLPLSGIPAEDTDARRLNALPQGGQDTVYKTLKAQHRLLCLNILGRVGPLVTPPPARGCAGEGN